MRPSFRATQEISLLFVFTLLAAFPASAQVATGTPPFGSFSGGPDIINLGNNNVHLDVPVVNKAGRGLNFVYELGYDSSVWYPVTSGSTTLWQPVPNWGWEGSLESSFGYISQNTILSIPCLTNQIPPQQTGTSYFYSWSYIDARGSTHNFGGTDQVDGTCSHYSTTSINTTASDGSGYKFSATGRTFNSLYNKQGQAITVPINSPGGGFGTLTDRNGNIISASGGVLTDTLGTTALTMAGSGTPSSPTTFTYTAPSGANASYTVKYTTYSIQTYFGCSGITEYGTNGTTTANLVSEIDLPDGSKYTFGYENTPAHTGWVTGRLASVTLPTGGTISYFYSGGIDGINCSDGSTPTLTRETPDTGTNSWIYARSQVSGNHWQTKITTPAGDDTVIDFQKDSAGLITNNFYEAQRVAYQGASSGGNVQRQWFTCYNGTPSACATTAVSSPITQRTVTDQYGSSGLECQHIYKYDSVGGLTEQDDYDYGSGSPGNLLRQILITYASLQPNITAFQQQVTLKNGTGTILSQTNYNYDENTPTPTSGITQHTSVSGSRGNLTSINYPVSGITSHFTYYDTGVLNTAQDVNNATSTYNYSSTNNAYCNWAFPTSISEPLSLSRSMTWNCTGGVQLTATDENNQTVTTNYNDAYFWRPASVTDQAQNTTSIAYAQGGAVVTPSLSFNNNNSLAAVAHNFDGLGRPFFDQRYQSPGGQNYDTVSYTYDANGRPYSTSLPCSVAAGSNCPSGTPKTTQTYDALGRPLVTTDSGLGTVTYSYSNNDVLMTVGPQTTGEHLKQRQLEYDALGRLTSVCELTTLSGSATCGQNTSQTGYWTKYSYDALGNLLQVTQNAQAASGSQQTRNYSYDAVSRLTSETNPESGTKSYVYDTDSTMCGNGAYSSNGDLLKTTDAAGNCVMLYYDALHRSTDIGTYPGGSCKRLRYDNTNGVLGSKPSGVSVSYTLGRLAEAETDTCVQPITQSSIITDEWFSYTSRGELSDSYESTPHSGAYYHAAATYWANGILSQLNGYAGSTINYSASWGVDPEDRPYSMSAGGTVSNTTYNAASQPTLVSFTWGDSDSYSYDPNTGRMTQYKFTVGSSPQSLIGNLTWNPNGTLSQLAITDPFNPPNAQTCNYSHDDLTRIAGANCGSAAAQTFSYDPFGNITKNGSPYAFNPTYSTSTNRMKAVGSFTPTYDNDGNVLGDSLHTYAWDAYGNSTTLDSVGLTFDAFDRMVEQNRSGAYTQIVYSPTGFKMQIFANGQSTPAKNFVPLPGGATVVYPSAGPVYIRHPDWLGSSRFATTGASRTMYFDTAYAPFGEPYASSGTTDLSFTGQNQDTTSGDYDFLYREYSIQGRWVSPDPAGLSAVDPTNPQSWNRYSYVGNSPLNSFDLLGLHTGCSLVQLPDLGDAEGVDSRTGGPFASSTYSFAAAAPSGGCGGPPPCEYTLVGCAGGGDGWGLFGDPLTPYGIPFLSFIGDGGTGGGWPFGGGINPWDALGNNSPCGFFDPDGSLAASGFCNPVIQVDVYAPYYRGGSSSGKFLGWNLDGWSAFFNTFPELLVLGAREPGESFFACVDKNIRATTLGVVDPAVIYNKALVTAETVAIALAANKSQAGTYNGIEMAALSAVRVASQYYGVGFGTARIIRDTVLLGGGGLAIGGAATYGLALGSAFNCR